MSIITISSNSEIIDTKISEQIADRINYKKLDKSIITEIASQYQLEQSKLNDVLETTPSLLKNISGKQWNYYLSCIESAVFDFMIKDNVICWGLGAHLYVKDISHVMKVRVLINEDQYINELAEQQKSTTLKIKKWLEGKNRQKKKWSMFAYNKDETDLDLYDFVVDLNKDNLDSAVQQITKAVTQRKYEPVTYSIKSLLNKALAAKVRVELSKSMNNIKVEVQDDVVIVSTKVNKRSKNEKISDIKELAGKIDGVKHVEVQIESSSSIF